MDLGIYNTYKQLKYKQKALKDLSKIGNLEEENNSMMPQQQPTELTPEQLAVIMNNKPQQNAV